jgi:hypothetical protein
MTFTARFPHTEYLPKTSGKGFSANRIPRELRNTENLEGSDDVTIELQCARCKRYYQPSKSDVLSGAYRLCPACRKPPAPSGGPIQLPQAA